MSQRPPASVGQRIEGVDTPALILDLDEVEKNLDTLRKSVANGVRVRAHAKTHKCPEIAKRQIAAGAIGVCCQKVSEAEALVEGGIQDVLVSNEIVGARKIKCLADSAACAQSACASQQREPEAIATTGARLDTTSSSKWHAPLRRGAGAPALALAREIVNSPTCASRPARLSRPRAARAFDRGSQGVNKPGGRRGSQHKSLFKQNGIDCPIVTAPAAGPHVSRWSRGVDEIQRALTSSWTPDYARNEWAAPLPRFEHALFVLATVMSRPSPQVAIVDAGLKASSVDSGMPTVWGKQE